MANSTDLVIAELSPIGVRRVRVVESVFDGEAPKLDVREYVSAANYEGFTKKGIRLSVEEATELKAHIEQFLALIATAPTA